MHDGISEVDLRMLKQFCETYQARFYAYVPDDSLFENLPVSRYYSKVMYFRLIAHEVLPNTVDRVLYLDPDILIINPLQELYSKEMEENLFAASIHTLAVPISNSLNKVRLNTYTSKGYYNSGVLLMNLKAQRNVISIEEIANYIHVHRADLILPDQDILNALYGHQILPTDDSLYNYDARRYNTYLITSGQKKDINWVMQNTAILHFCGKSKPWHKKYAYKFGPLYKHYMQKTNMV